MCVDALAGELASWGRVARSLPNVWRGGVSYPVRGPQGQYIGKMLPGKGLYLDCDLKAVGITRPVLGVVERSTVRRLQDFLTELHHHEGGAITTLQGVKAAIQAGLGQKIIRTQQIASEIGQFSWVDLFSGGTNPTTGVAQVYASIPGGQIYDTSSQGVLNAGMSDPVGTNTTYLISFGANIQSGGAGNPGGYTAMYVVSDLLVAAGAIPTDTTSTVTIDTVALPRYTSGAGVLMTFLQVIGGATPGIVITIAYTNQAGASSTTTYMNNTGDATPGNCVMSSPNSEQTPVPYCTLQPGDFGIQSVQSFTPGTADTAGNKVAVQLEMPMMFVPATAVWDDYAEYDSTALIEGLTQVALTTSTGHVAALTVKAFCNATDITTTQNHILTFCSVQG